MPDPIHRPLIVAHRGASALAPENTIAAFERAIADGAEGIEFDVRLTKEGRAAVIHDATLERTCGRAGRVSELTIDELKQIDAGSWYNAAFPTLAERAFRLETIPALEDTLDRLSKFEGTLYIELKSQGAETRMLAKAVCNAVSASPLRPRVIVKSFDLSAISFVRENCSNIRTAALFAPRLMNVLRKDKNLVRVAADLGADELSLHYGLVTGRLMKKAAVHGLPVTIWTADRPLWIRRGASLGVKAIITNDPARLLAKRNALTGAVT